GPTGVGVTGVGVGRYSLATNGKYCLKSPMPEPEARITIMKKNSEIINPPVQIRRFLFLSFMLLPAACTYNNRANLNHCHRISDFRYAPSLREPFPLNNFEYQSFPY